MQENITVSNKTEWVRICRSRGARIVGNRAYKGESLVGRWQDTSGVFQPAGGLEPSSAKVVRRALRQAEKAIRQAYRRLQEDVTPYDTDSTKNGGVEDGVADFVNQPIASIPVDTKADRATTFGPGFKGTDGYAYPSDKGTLRSNTPGQTKESARRRASR